MSYKQITQMERYIIQRMRKSRHSFQEIAEVLDRHKSSISREYRRNKHVKRVYIANRAQGQANGRRSRTRRKSQFGSRDWAIIRNLLRQGLSPEQASGVLKRVGLLSISHQTIYTYIWKDKQAGGKLWKRLRQSGKQRRKGYGKSDSRGRLQGKRKIEDRPKIVDERRRKGDYEIDLVHGSKRSKQCILVLVDRKTRMVFIRKLRDKSMAEVNRAMIPILKKLRAITVTADNGSEFHDYKRVEKLTGSEFYFANSYASWERGTCENTNGLIRQYLPKNKTMVGVSQWECNRIAKRLNQRPRKILHYKSPEELFYGIPLSLHF